MTYKLETAIPRNTAPTVLSNVVFCKLTNMKKKSRKTKRETRSLRGEEQEHRVQ
jgi:hypothetical protein